MLRQINFLLLSILLAVLVVSCSQSPANTKKIGIIEPISVKAMDEIVKGFETTLQQQSPYPIEFKVANAQGDMNMERAIVMQMQAQNYDVIAPIGSDATEMTASIIKNNPIVSLAASFSEQDRKQRNPCNIAVVHDEIQPSLSMQFLHQVYPHIKNMVVIHSASDKILPQVQQTIAAGQALGINVKDMMAPTLNDIYSVANNIPTGTQAIFVLKDSLIVNGMTTLEIVATKNHMLLYTSDQGSVQDGAGLALGVHEQDIGVDGGELAAKILAGKAACSLPIVEMTKLTVFINAAALQKEGVDQNAIAQAAQSAHYNMEIVSGSSNE